MSVVDHICTVMLSRPERRNAYTESMRAELCDAFEKASTNEDVRVVVLTGDPAGQAFCAGADLGTGDVGKEFTSGSAKYDVPNGRKVDNGTFRDGGGRGRFECPSMHQTDNRSDEWHSSRGRNDSSVCL